MKFISLQPFVPSGENFEGSKQLFLDLGFTMAWDAGDYVSFQKDGCKFILQKFNDKTFAENYMISVAVDNVDEFCKEVNEKQLAEKFGVRFSKPMNVAYGREVNMIDLAGVCWHFVG